MRPTRISVLLFALAILLPALAAAAEDAAAPAPLTVERLLTAGPLPLATPAFFDSELAGVSLEDQFQALAGVPGRDLPAAGRGFATAVGAELRWQEWAAPDFDLPVSGAAVRYAACYLVADRWQQATLRLGGERPSAAVLDGAALTLAEAAATDSTAAARTAELTLTPGKHLLVVRSLYDPLTAGSWPLTVSLLPGGEAVAGSLSVTLDPAHAVDIHTILDAPRISGLALSPDGKLVAVTLGEIRDGEHQESWLELRNTADGSLVTLWRGEKNPARATWNPLGRRLGWQTSQGEKTTVWLYDLDSGETRLVLADVEKLGAWAWAPDGRSLVYEIERTSEPDPRKVKRVLHPADRQPWWRGRSHLMQAPLDGGPARRLTAGPLSPEGWSVSPDGRSLLFFTSEPTPDRRPFFSRTLWLLDLATLETTRLLDDPWIEAAVWSPDSRTLCLQGSSSAFAELGRALPEGVQANDYGGQLYLFDLATRRPRAITRGFTPAVDAMWWTPADGRLYAQTTDTQFSNIYRYDQGKDRWERVQTGVEFTDQFVLPLSGRTAVARGTGNTAPNRLYTVDLKQNQAKLLLDPGTRAYRDVVFGKVEPWVAELPGGERLDGRIYYPPGFDPARKYPLIVYYYGGTSPVTVDFGGRYPKNVWAGQGYLIYVPEPSGATGYGQEFAARHVNDWGIRTAGEVIEGTKAFLAAHHYADPAAVGCLGASYGGFLTEYLVTQTDLFAGAISHAGISSLSSYWGEGLWGYVYGARALADAYPWSHRDLYIEQSPLFNADKITTPLLLLHGDGDTNVPVGESDQLFTALKILGREVEYVQIQGQDHWVLDHGQRLVWNDTILAWFARTLKRQPGWWNGMYPEPKDFR